jgi:hypothetical protein
MAFRRLVRSVPQQRIVTRSLSTALRSGTGTGYGFINPTSTDKYYTREVDFPRDFQAFTTPGLMWEAARQDAKAAKLPVEDHLAAIEGLVVKFFRDGGLFDSEELLAVVLPTLVLR